MAFPPASMLGWIGIILLGVGAARYLGFLKGVPVPRKQAGVVALIGLLIFAYGEGYLTAKEATIVKSGELTPLATFAVDVQGITSGTYDEDTKTFSVAVSYDSVTDSLSINSTTITFTVRRTDTSTEDAVTKVLVNNVEWYDDQTNTKYTLLDKALITPEGAASSEDEALVLLPAAGSKTVTVQLVFNKAAIAAMEQYSSKTITINIGGQTFFVNIIRA